ncbi:hypothetical protein LC048_10270 [Mesobacillus subterraneus]|nr:hypothetical protein [Mesobacillus subterraneus]WLR57206.1 hypothetical protein LC048_10270 [Mesobacillus subterraneus]
MVLWFNEKRREECFQLLSISASIFNAGINPVQSNAEFGQVL